MKSHETSDVNHEPGHVGAKNNHEQDSNLVEEWFLNRFDVGDLVENFMRTVRFKVIEAVGRYADVSGEREKGQSMEGVEGLKGNQFVYSQYNIHVKFCFTKSFRII